MINKNKIFVICASLALVCAMSAAVSGCDKNGNKNGDLTDAPSTGVESTTVYEMSESEEITEASSEDTTEKVTEAKTEKKTEGDAESDTEGISQNTESDETTTLAEVESEITTEGFSDTDSTDTEKTEDESVTEEKTEEMTYPAPREGTDILHEGFGENKNYVVVIDAGHQRYGMTDKEPNGPGSDVMKAMVSSGTYGRFTDVPEYELNLKVAMSLRDELMSRGYTVVMVRETHDVEVSNVGRAQIANKYAPNEENGYISTINVRIHANGSDNANSNGALMCAPTKNNPYKIGELYEECLALANAIIDPYCESTGIKKCASHILYGDNMTGTNWSEVPTTILEMGFMTNKQDDLRMQTESFSKNAASGIADGIDNFFASYR